MSETTSAIWPELTYAAWEDTRASKTTLASFIEDGIEFMLRRPLNRAHRSAAKRVE